jgi:coniferyl-aldehyde dehydrogenase
MMARDTELTGCLEAQRAAFVRDGSPTLSTRIDRLNRAVDLLVTHRHALNDAMCADFGHRSHDMSDLTDIAGALGALKFARANVAKWMRPQRRGVEFPFGLLGARAEVRFKPKGVIGVISPWNFPVNLTFGPLAGVLAAGNRCMIKPSEFTEATSNLMKRLIGEYFSVEEVVVVTGGPAVGAAFTALPFDHLLFTGATSVARHVMRAAAENLVPVTLELGGKSPVIVGRSADLPLAATRIMAGKTMNAGQICVAPDYAFVPAEMMPGFVAAARRSVATMYPSGLVSNPDYTSVFNRRHYDRITHYLDEARTRGANVIAINPANEDFSRQPHHKVAPHLVIDPADDLSVMQDEIFGPILPIKPYTQTSEAIDFINARPRPLSLYYFGEDLVERDAILTRTTSGGVAINDVIFHVAQEDLPFGGVGPSGIGAYHGHDGFLEFSHRTAIFTQVSRDLLGTARPPYRSAYRMLVRTRLRK